jgi:osmotically-inducible protein OsmY
MTSKHPLTLAAALAVLCCGALHAADESDQQIEAAAKDSYVFRNYLKHDSVRIKSDDGNVTLKGTVENEAHKTLAAETAAGLSGVKEVDNQLQVKGEPSKSSDAWITAKVKTALLMHKNVSAKNTKVSTKDGVVTLRGEADSADQKDMTTEFAREVDGVRDAVNNMKVVGAPKRSEESTGEKVDDASITAQVKTALLFNRSTSALNTKVETDGGVVTIDGTARTEDEKSLVSKIASDVRGVQKVDNQMTVSP